MLIYYDLSLIIQQLDSRSFIIEWLFNAFWLVKSTECVVVSIETIVLFYEFQSERLVKFVLIDVVLFEHLFLLHL